MLCAWYLHVVISEACNICKLADIKGVGWIKRSD